MTWVTLVVFHHGPGARRSHRNPADYQTIITLKNHHGTALKPSTALSKSFICLSTHKYKPVKMSPSVFQISRGASCCYLSSSGVVFHLIDVWSTWGRSRRRKIFAKVNVNGIQRSRFRWITSWWWRPHMRRLKVGWLIGETWAANWSRIFRVLCKSRLDLILGIMVLVGLHCFNFLISRDFVKREKSRPWLWLSTNRPLLPQKMTAFQ